MRRYICLSCFYEWDSKHEREEMTCPQCHRRQGVDYVRFRRAIDSAKKALEDMLDSLPPSPPPSPLSGFTAAAEGLGAVLDAARKEFPNPLLPLRFAREIFRRSVDELKGERRSNSNPAD